MWKHADALVSIEAPENTRELSGLPGRAADALIQGGTAAASRARALEWT